MVLLMLVIGIVCLQISAVIAIYYKSSKDKRILNIISSFPAYMALQEHFYQRAFDIVYKDQILIYSVEATKINEKQFDYVTKEFARLVIKLMGPTIVRELEYVYGNMDTVIFNAIEYFNTRYEEDEIYKSSVSNLMDEDLDIKTD